MDQNIIINISEDSNWMSSLIKNNNSFKKKYLLYDVSHNISKLKTSKFALNIFPYLKEPIQWSELPSIKLIIGAISDLHDLSYKLPEIQDTYPEFYLYSPNSIYPHVFRFICYFKPECFIIEDLKEKFNTVAGEFFELQLQSFNYDIKLIKSSDKIMILGSLNKINKTLNEVNNSKLIFNNFIKWVDL